MTWVTLPDRNTRWSSVVSPHIPGRRRPQMRHSAASARVRGPQEGQRIVRTSLRNIGRVLGGALLRLDPGAFVEPHAQVDQAAAGGAEGALGITRPGDFPPAASATPARQPR